jgi:2-polyprenyl-3-methyl-5-hydroxy-6-metoxy-1,4-benzoquinol methylase
MTKEEILEVNQQQKEFYNFKKKNLATTIWSKIRGGLLGDIRKQIGIQKQTYDTHKAWLGDLSNKKVLDLGCYSGNYLSVYIAEHSKQYIGLDLSDKGIAELQKKISHIDSAKAIANDLFSDEFEEKDFDVIYAYGVLHHFKNVDLLIEKLKEKLCPNGVVISYDPLETSFPVKTLRTLYRPFQTDKDWEWPFSKSVVHKFRSRFNVVELHGLLGKSKWFFTLMPLPISKSKKIEIGSKWHQLDWDLSQQDDHVLFSCMHITMLLKNKK